MSDITVRRHSATQMIRPLSAWDPLRIVRDLFSWDPLRRLSAAGLRAEMMPFVPAFEIKESDRGYVMNADLPGLNREDLQISLTGRTLTVRGKRAVSMEDQSETYYVSERSFGTFTRSFTLPDILDEENLSANLADGVLTITIPKKAGGAARTIEVGVEAGKRKIEGRHAEGRQAEGAHASDGGKAGEGKPGEPRKNEGPRA